MKPIVVIAALCFVFAGCDVQFVGPAEDIGSKVAQISEPVSDHPLGFMFGEWTGEAKGIGPDQHPYAVKQTERVGPMLDGAVVLVEGRGYDTDGELQFNALGLISKNASGDGWEIRSYANGQAGTFPFVLRDKGYVWRTPAGPNASMVYKAWFKDNSWTSVGEFTIDGQPPREVFSMSLTRKGDTKWPEKGAVKP